MYTHWFPYLIDASHKIWLQLAKWFQRRRRLNIMVIYMYIATGWGHMTPWVQFFFPESLIFNPTTHFLQDFHLKSLFKSFPHSNALVTYVDLVVKKVKVHHHDLSCSQVNIGRPCHLKVTTLTYFRWGQLSPLASIFSESLIFTPTAHFLQDFHFK